MSNEMEAGASLVFQPDEAQLKSEDAKNGDSAPVVAEFPAPEFGLGGVIVQFLTSVGAGFWLRNSYEWPLWAPFALVLVWVPAFWWFVKHVRFDS